MCVCSVCACGVGDRYVRYVGGQVCGVCVCVLGCELCVAEDSLYCI